MVSDKSKANLAKGREKGIKRKAAKNQCNQNNTFDAILTFIESCKLTNAEWQVLEEKLNIKRADVYAAGITDERKFKKMLNFFFDDSPQTVKEYLQRREPQDIGIKINFATLSDEQVRRIANGEDPRTVLATPSASGA